MKEVTTAKSGDVKGAGVGVGYEMKALWLEKV